MRIWKKIRYLLNREAFDRELREEMQVHRDMAEEKLKQSGKPDDTARYGARKAFGNATVAEESSRRQWTFFFEELVQDLRFGARMLRKNPGFTLIAVLTLGLGIGANTALFSIVNGVLLNPLGYPHSGELVAVYGKNPGLALGPISYLNFLDWQRDNKTFSSMAMYRNQDYNFIGTDVGERLTGYMVSAEFFQTLGVTPVLGRNFQHDDDRPGVEPVVILGGGFWKRDFGSSLDVAGKSINLNGTTYTIVGVVPAGFTFYGQSRDVYTPIGEWTDPSFRDRRIEMSAHAIGRLKTGVPLSQADADMEGIAQNLAATYPEADKKVGVTLVSMKEDIVGNVQPFLIVLLAAVGFLLLIACANVANLLLARSMARSREFAVREAMGASHARVIRQLLTESVLLAGMGGAIGLALAYWATNAALRILPVALPRAGDISLDSRVLLFTLGISLFAGITFGLAPALKSSCTNLHEVLKESGRGSSGARHRLQGIFVAVEIAMSLILLVGAGLMVRSLAALWRVNPGFNPNHAITFTLSMPGGSKRGSDEARARLRRFDDKMHSIPGVQAVSVTLGSRPMIHNSTDSFWIDGEPKPATLQEMHQALFYLVEAGFQEAMGVTLERGRFITPQDDEHSPVVIVVDDVFARTYFPDQNPVGKHIHFATFNVEAEIVGVVGHIKQWGIDSDSKSALQAQYEYPFMQLPERLMPLVAEAVAVVLRTEGEPTAVMGHVRAAVKELDSRGVVYNVQTLGEVVSNSFAARRLSMILLSVFAALALVLACVGIYGVISYLVGQRTHEIGVRVALGAQSSDVVRLIIGHGMRMALVGVVAGTVAALGLTRLMANQLFGVGARDPLTFVGVGLLLMAVAVGACYVPARRAMRVDPIVALRAE